jgi:hypothetical protein
MDENLLNNLLKQKAESDWYDFKAKQELFDKNGKVIPKKRDEFIKDILAMANGNSSIIRENKYIIIGAEDKKFTDDGFRKLVDVDYKIPSNSRISKWLDSACSTSVVGIENKEIRIFGKKVWVVCIPPTFQLHETSRELTTHKTTHSKHTVFIRQNEHVAVASIGDGIAIQDLKHLHRQDIANPPSMWVGALTGGIVGWASWHTGYQTNSSPPSPTAYFLINLIIISFTIFLGGQIGWIFKEFKQFKFDWAFYSRKKKRKITTNFLTTVIFGGVAYWLISLLTK